MLEDRLTPTTLHWLGAAGANGNLWSVASNWAENQAPTSGSTLVFDTTTTGFSATTNGFAPTNDIAGLAGLTVVVNDASAAGDFAISGDALGLTTTGIGIESTLSVGTAAAINNPIALAANTTVDVGLGALTLGGVVSGGFSLTESGSPAGTLTLNAANTYTGGTVLAGGTVSVNTSTSLGTGTLTFEGGTLANAAAFLNLANPFVVNAPSTIGGGSFLTLSGDGTLNANLSLTNSGFLTLDGALSGNGGLIENGGIGSTTLGGTAANTFTGGTNILSGGVSLQKSAGVNALESPVTIVGGSGNLTLNASDQLNGNVSVSLGAGGSFNTNSQTDSVLSVSGAGTLNTGGNAGAGLTITGGGTQLLAAQVTGSGFLTYDGSGSLTLGGTSSSYTGTLTVAAGTLLVSANFSGATVAVTGGVLGGTGVVKSVTATGGTLAPTTGGTVSTFSTATGANATSLNGATFQVDLTAQTSDQLVLGTNATLNLTGATLALNATGATLGSEYQIVTSPTGGLSGTFNGLANGATLTVAGQTFQISYTANAVTLTKVGATTPTTLHWTGAASSNWSAAGNWEEGAAPVSGDTLVFDTTTAGFAATTAAFAPTNDITGLTGLTVVVNDASAAGDFAISGDALGLTTTGIGIESTLSVGTAAAINNPIALAANTTVDVGLGALTLGGVVSGGFSLTESGSPAGTLTLNAANTYTGGTVLAGGTVSVNTSTSLGTGTLTFEGGTLANAAAFLNLANPFVVNAPSTIGGGSFLTLSGDGTLNANLSLTNSGFLTLDGALSGNGGLIENGFPGNTILGGTAANTFTGTTTIISGTLEVDKTPGVQALSSPLIVIGGGAFPTLSWSANNQLNGTVSILSFGHLATNGNSDSVSGLNGTGSIDTGSTATAGLTVTGGGSNTVTGAVTGSGLLTYNGTGYLLLAGASSSYTGKLTAAQGALFVAADFSGASGVASGSGALGGTGIVGTLASGGTGAINLGGSSVGGTLSTKGGSGLASALAGETLQVDLTDLGPSDQLVVGDAATLSLTNVALGVNVLHSTAGAVFTIVSSATGGISGTFLGLPDGSTVTAGGRSFVIHYTATAVTLTDGQGGITLSPSALPAGEVGLSYNQSITSSGGSGTVTLAVSGVTNTTGLTISGSGTGSITVSGTPTSSGTVTFTVTPTDSNGTGSGKVYSFTVNPAVALTPATLPAGEVGVSYSQSVTPSGGSGAVTLAVSGVTNTTGLTISGSGTGTITLSGAPTSAGTVTFTVTPTDSSGTGTGTVYSFTVSPAVVLTPATLPVAALGLPYNQSITSSGGSGAVTLAVSGVTNTTGLTISGSGTGAITLSGTPTASGTVTFTVTPTDSNGTGSGKVYSITVGPAPVLTPPALPAAEVGLSYNQTVTSAGGVGAVALAVSGVTNTTGLTISGSGTETITISGTPTSSGTVTFTVTPAAGTAIVYSFVVRAKPLIAAATAGAGSGTVTVYDPLSGALVAQFQPFGAYAGGVKVAVGDVNGDGYSDLIVMAGPGALNGLVEIYSGRDLSLMSTYFAFPGYQGAFNIAAGDLTGNGVADVIFSTATGGDFVFAYAGASNTFIVPVFSAFGGFTGGVTIAAGDLTGIGRDEIIVGTASQVGAAGVFNQYGQLLQPYYFAPIPMNGVNVAAGDLNDSGHDDLIFGAKDSTLVLTYDGESQGLMGYFFALPGQPYGVTVATVDPTGDGYADLVIGFTGNVSAIALFTGLSFQLADVYGQPSGAGGVNVAGSA
ncbi:beta strand repeat-containing protein [Frigoriglobus tundricola]|uniref:beta strand repeat-containing protein n=1 Tax=Frigoriglobus tundricola TaxID=2774151 RepID=UPI001D092F43|nr:autotransporter-associated beta strand repeat-containing protein [Frigoriglobus tundricola]